MKPQISIRSALFATLVFAAVFAIAAFKYSRFKQTDIYKLQCIRKQILTASELHVIAKVGYRITDRDTLESLASVELWPQTIHATKVNTRQADDSELILVMVIQPKGDPIFFSLSEGYLCYRTLITTEPLSNVTGKLKEIMKAHRDEGKSFSWQEKDDFFEIREQERE